MHETSFIQDLAIIMLIAGIITVIFHRLHQPVVLGYILAGIIIGPHTPPFGLVQDQHSIQIFADLGVIFLMFSLGLEFNLRKLKTVGITALVAAVVEIIVMLWIGYEIGQFFQWGTLDSIFLGAMLAISSTTIIVKAITELKLQREAFVQLIYGILIVEDILAIAIIALLSSVGATHVFNFSTVFVTLGQLLVFLIVSLAVGILAIPRLIESVSNLKNQEILLITTLGICFGFCLLVIKLQYSVVLGAFIIGAIIAESAYLPKIEKIVAPLRDMFSAVFFVAVGLMFDPKILVAYYIPIIVITIAVIVGKILTCSVATYLTGHGGRTSLKVGMGLAQIGEFSFIIAALGNTTKVTGSFLYPIAVAVSAITTMTTPYLIRTANPLAKKLSHSLPEKIVYIFRLYTLWLQSIADKNTPSEIKRIVKRSLINIFVNLALITAIFIGVSHLLKARMMLVENFINLYFINTLLWSGALFISLPFLVAIYRKLKALSMLLAELSIKSQTAGRFTQQVRRTISEVIPIISILAILLYLCALSISILPPTELLMMIFVIAIIITAALWRWFIKLHSRLQIALMESVKKDEA